MTDIKDLKGYCVSLCISGSVTPQFGQCWFNMARHNDSIGLINVEYSIKPGQFVESARDDAVKHALDPRGDGSQKPYDWVLMVDADATFPQETLQRLLQQAYINYPEAGAVGAYSQLKGRPHLPTIDTGTGKWEEHYPGEGVLPVIRTGCHCFLIKTHVFRRLGPPPWFRTRISGRPAQAMKELDNFARTLLNGENPLTSHPEWNTLLEAASNVGGSDQIVGEDSAFFDRCRAHGIQIMVDCDLSTGHVAQKIIQPSDFRDNVRESKRVARAALGVGE